MRDYGSKESGTELTQLSFRAESVDSWFFLSFPRYVDSVIRGSGRGEEPSGGNVLRLIQIRRSSVWRKLRQLVKQKMASPNRRFKFQKSRQLSSARTTKRFPSSRCASATKIVRRLESTVATQPQLQPALLRYSAMISQYFNSSDV